ncbi:MAG: BatD family protein [Bacteroidota bacterium]
MSALVFAMLFLSTSIVFSQPNKNNISVQLGPDKIGENEAWTITITVSNERLTGYDKFPEIEGFRNRGISTQSQTSVINGQISSTQGVVMTYLPTKQGTFNVPTFTVKVNNIPITVPGKKVVVGPAVQARSNDPFRSLFEDDFFSRTEPEFVDVKEEAFLALTTSKDEVYVGEGVTTTLSFFVADNNRAPLHFHDLGKQLSDILKKVRPANCWEENFNIENIEGEIVSINGRGYTEYKIYQGTFYPLNEQTIRFPSVGLEMLKYKLARNPSFFGQNRLEDYKTFYTKAKTVKVKGLPPHPMRDAVAVGNYRLEERLNTTTLQTGQSVSYDFGIYGEGNVSAIDKPTVRNNETFELYEPNVKQNINRDNRRVTGSKTFSYFMIPKEPGKYNLGDYFQWVYFNSTTRKYDTLKSKQIVTVHGESKKNQSIESSDLGSFYDNAETASNQLQTRSNNNWIKWGANIFAILMVGVSVFLISRKAK